MGENRDRQLAIGLALGHSECSMGTLGCIFEGRFVRFK